jgi:hypothetical protein
MFRLALFVGLFFTLSHATMSQVPLSGPNLCPSGYFECPDGVACCQTGWKCAGNNGESETCTKTATPADSIWWVYLLISIFVAIFIGIIRRACMNNTVTMSSEEHQRLLASNPPPPTRGGFMAGEQTPQSNPQTNPKNNVGGYAGPPR